MKLNDYIVELDIDEIKYKYIRWSNMGVTYANPPSYEAQNNHHNKSYIEIDYKLEEEYNKPLK